MMAKIKAGLRFLGGPRATGANFKKTADAMSNLAIKVDAQDLETAIKKVKEELEKKKAQYETMKAAFRPPGCLDKPHHKSENNIS